MYVEQIDFSPFIKETRLVQMLDGDTQALPLAVEIAIGVVNDALYSRYDTVTIFAKTGSDRDKQVVRWVIVLSLYYLYERLPDKLVPERIVKNYDDTIALLTDIEDAKKSTNLPLLENTNNGSVTPFTKFRWGSIAPRTH